MQRSCVVFSFVACFAGWSKLQPAKRTPPNTSRNKSSHTQRTENKTTDVVIHQHSRKLLKMDILMSEACWAPNKWNKIASDIKLVFHSSTIAMMHGPINIRSKIKFGNELCWQWIFVPYFGPVTVCGWVVSNLVWNCVCISIISTHVNDNGWGYYNITLWRHVYGRYWHLKSLSQSKCRLRSCSYDLTMWEESNLRYVKCFKETGNV